jgi:hypothetical protein
MPKEIDPDLRQAYEALAEARAKLADPRRLYTRSDQLYPDPRFRPSYVDPSMEKPVYQGMLPGGTEDPTIDPLDLIPAERIVSIGTKGAMSIPALIGALGDWKKEGIKLERKLLKPDLDVNHPRQIQEIIAYSPEGKIVGQSQYYNYPDKPMMSPDVHITEENRRKGIATAMHELAEKESGRKILQGSQTDDAKALWDQTERPFGVKKEDLESYLESLKEAPIPESMSLLDRIKLAAKRSKIKAPEMEAAQLEREALRNKPKDFFDKAREKANQKIFDENEKKLAQEFKSGFEPGWYHGTSLQTPIEEFKPGSFFTKDPKFANVFTEKLEPTYAGMVRDQTQGHVVPVSLRTNNFFDTKNPEHLETFKNYLKQSFENERPNISEFPDLDNSNTKMHKIVMDQLMGKETYDSEKLAQAVIDHIKEQKGNWMGLEDKPLINLIKNRGGYSGMFVDEYGINPVTGQYTDEVLKNAMAFDPHDIRLPWAKFDPKKALSKDTLSGLAAAGLSFDQVKDLLNKKSTDKDEY